MKKILCIILAALCLTSCSSGKSIEPRLRGISFSAEMTYYNESYSFDGCISADGVLTALITSPKELDGLEFTLNGKATTVNYKGLTYTPAEGSMPFCRMIEGFYAPLFTLLSEDALPTADKDGTITRGHGAEAFTLHLSPMGLPQALQIPDERFCITFYNISVSEDVNE